MASKANKATMDFFLSQCAHTVYFSTLPILVFTLVSIFYLHTMLMAIQSSNVDNTFLRWWPPTPQPHRSTIITRLMLSFNIYRTCSNWQFVRHRKCVLAKTASCIRLALHHLNKTAISKHFNEQ